MKLSEIVKAWEEGKQIQWYNDMTSEWTDKLPSHKFFCQDYKYRIKPQTLKYRIGLFKSWASENIFVMMVKDEHTEQQYQEDGSFVRWVTDWIEVEV